MATATSGHLVGADTGLSGAAFDSRVLRPGQLFVPLVAERDGHDFVEAARLAGAGAYLTSRGHVGWTGIEVDDTAHALMALAAWARTQLVATAVGITGSVGKTTTKDMIVAAVGAGRRVAGNERSFNNEQGLPVTILEAPDDTEVLVVEMGMRGLGEIARLCEIARPTIGVVTTVGASHTELLGGIEGVARAKRELVEALPTDGTAILNADDVRVSAMANATRADVVTFGRAAGADVCIDGLRLDGSARARFTIRSPWGSAEVVLSTTGAHMASNAAAALAVAGTTGVEIAEAAGALAGAAISPSRMQVHRTATGGIIVDDAYNANPTSMRAALDALAAIGADRRVAVLGLMAELDDPRSAHREIAEHAAALGIEVIAVRTALYGIDPVDDLSDVVDAVGDVDADTAVLVKASRVAALDVVAATLTGRVQ